MKTLVGVDEAGYGPNLGPLVIATSAWELPDDGQPADLYGRLAPEVAARSNRRATEATVTLADSKSLYSPTRGLALLERGVLGATALNGAAPSSWREAFAQLAPDSWERLALEPWNADYDEPLPLACDAAGLTIAAARLQQATERAGVRLLALRAVIVPPPRWNELTRLHGSKGVALSNVSLGLVAAMLGRLPSGPVSITCDKHGGRNRYGPLLQQFVDVLVEVHAESAHESRYAWGAEERRVEVVFRPRAEAHLPTALASMVAKYLRELAMRAFNAWWQRHVPGLRPTAGYPVDARRFMTDIAPARARLGVPDALLWREK